MLTPTPATIAKGLSAAQRAWFMRGFIRIGNPHLQVPRLDPFAPDQTWVALERKGLLMKTLFGLALTPLGEQVRAHLTNAASETK